MARMTITAVLEHTTESELDVTDVSQLPRVDILYTYSDIAGDLIDASVANGAKGIVIAEVGNGGMNKTPMETAGRAAKRGVIVVRSSRGAPRNRPAQRRSERGEMNSVATDELNPQKARILLMLALLMPRITREIQNLFCTY